MNNINLRKTHRLLYRTFVVKGITGIALGLGIIIAPDVMLGSSAYDTINDILPPPISGVVWLALGAMIIFALIKNRYKTVRVGIAGMAVLFATWSIGFLSNQIMLGVPWAYMFAVFIYASMSISTLLLLLEPPLNPETAIKTKKES